MTTTPRSLPGVLAFVALAISWQSPVAALELVRVGKPLVSIVVPAQALPVES